MYFSGKLGRFLELFPGGSNIITDNNEIQQNAIKQTNEIKTAAFPGTHFKKRHLLDTQSYSSYAQEKMNAHNHTMGCAAKPNKGRVNGHILPQILKPTQYPRNLRIDTELLNGFADFVKMNVNMYKNYVQCNVRTVQHMYVAYLAELLYQLAGYSDCH